jgi:hypothetical protein
MRNTLACVALIGVIGVVSCLSACGGSASSVAASATATTAPSPIPTQTPSPAAGVCRMADFPPPIRQQPNPPTGGDPGPFYGAPIGDFPFPPLTYYYDPGPAMGTHQWRMCSPGDPASILAFMRGSIAASSWMLLNPPGANAMSLVAQKPAATPTIGTTTPAYCSTLNVIVGAFPGYPGEWTFVVSAPAVPCQ